MGSSALAGPGKGFRVWAFGTKISFISAQKKVFLLVLILFDKLAPFSYKIYDTFIWGKCLGLYSEDCLYKKIPCLGGFIKHWAPLVPHSALPWLELTIGFGSRNLNLDIKLLLCIKKETKTAMSENIRVWSVNFSISGLGFVTRRKFLKTLIYYKNSNL